MGIFICLGVSICLRVNCTVGYKTYQTTHIESEFASDICLPWFLFILRSHCQFLLGVASPSFSEANGLTVFLVEALLIIGKETS